MASYLRYADFDMPVTLPEQDSSGGGGEETASASYSCLEFPWESSFLLPSYFQFESILFVASSTCSPSSDLSQLNRWASKRQRPAIMQEAPIKSLKNRIYY